jgi:cytochrome c oxidase subunit 1
MSLTTRLLRNALRLAAIAAPAMVFVLGPIIWSFFPRPQMHWNLRAPLSAQDLPEPPDPLLLIHLEYALSVLLIAIPAGIVLGDWIGKLRRHRLVFDTPVLWVLGMLLLAATGIATGIALANASSDAVLQDTFYVVMQYRYTFRICAVFAIFAGFYFWFPAITGYAYNTVLGRLQFWAMFAGVSIGTFPQLWMAFHTVPRHYADLPDAFVMLNRMSTAGVFIAALGLLVFPVVLVEAFVRRRKAVLESGGTA